MYEFEIKNKVTQDTATVITRTFHDACRAMGWNTEDCRLVWKSTALDAIVLKHEAARNAGRWVTKNGDTYWED